MNLRLQKLQSLLQKQHLDAAVITSIPNIIYLTGYTGFLPDEREAYLVITKEGAYILTNALYAEEVRNQIPHLILIELHRDNKFIDVIKKLVTNTSINSVAIEEYNLTAGEYIQLQKLPVTIKPINLSSLRVIKNSEEITVIQKACDIGDNAFMHILKKIQPGITEKMIAHELDLFMKQHNANPSFRAIVAFGKNAAIPHHVSSDDVLTKNMCVLLDFGVKTNNYCSDMSRTIFVGKITKEQKTIYQTVQGAQKAAITFIEKKLNTKQKILGDEVDAVSRVYIHTRGFNSFPHSLGHGIGLEVHEPPRLSPVVKDVLQEGMVFSIEPGIYMENYMGVRIEDLFTIYNGKLNRLTKSTQDVITV